MTSGGLIPSSYRLSKSFKMEGAITYVCPLCRTKFQKAGKCAKCDVTLIRADRATTAGVASSEEND